MKIKRKLKGEYSKKNIIMKLNKVNNKFKII